MKRKVTFGLIIIVILVAVYFILVPSKTGGQAGVMNDSQQMQV